MFPDFQEPSKTKSRTHWEVLLNIIYSNLAGIRTILKQQEEYTTACISVCELDDRVNKILEYDALKEELQFEHDYDGRVRMLDEAELPDALALLKCFLITPSDMKIARIKAVRVATGFCLKDAKSFVELPEAVSIPCAITVGHYRVMQEADSVQRALDSKIDRLERAIDNESGKNQVLREEIKEAENKVRRAEDKLADVEVFYKNRQISSDYHSSVQYELDNALFELRAAVELIIPSLTKYSKGKQFARILQSELDFSDKRVTEMKDKLYKKSEAAYDKVQEERGGLRWDIEDYDEDDEDRDAISEMYSNFEYDKGSAHESIDS